MKQLGQKSTNAALILSTLLLCSCSGIIDQQIEKYLQSPKGQELVDQRVKQVLIGLSQGKSLDSNMAQPKNKIDIPIDGNPVMGAAGAKHTLVAFIDYTDASSAQLLQSAEAIIRKKGKDFLKIVVKFAPVPSNNMSIPAAKAALSVANLGKFEAFHRQLIASPLSIDQKKIGEIAKASGVALNDFNKNLLSEEVAKKIQQDNDLLQKIEGVTGVPTAYLDGIKVDRTNYNIDAMLDMLK